MGSLLRRDRDEEQGSVVALHAVVDRVHIDDSYASVVTDVGTGPPIVLVHGTPLDATGWASMMPILTRRRRVIAYDIRGHGSASDVALPDSYEILADDLMMLLDRRVVERAHIVGHSFGGQIVQTFAGRHATRVSAATIMCARSTPYPPFADAADNIERNGIEQIRNDGLRRWFTADQLTLDSDSVRYVRSRLTADAAATLTRAFRMIAAFDITPRLNEITAPIRFIAASRDTVATPHDLQAAAQSIPTGDFVLAPDAGHMLPIDQPARSASLIAQTS